MVATPSKAVRETVGTWTGAPHKHVCQDCWMKKVLKLVFLRGSRLRLQVNWKILSPGSGMDFRDQGKWRQVPAQGSRLICSQLPLSPPILAETGIGS